MSGPIRSELLKLRTTRTFLGITLTTIGLVALIAGAAAAAGDYGAPDDPSAGLDLITVGGIAQPFALALGILAVSTEFRHGTITPTLLAAPSRLRLVGAKLAAHGVAGLALGLAAFALAAAVAFPVLASRGIPLDLGTGETIEVVVGGVLGVALLACVGVGLGALVRNQVGAIIGAFGWWFVIEPLLTGIPGVGGSIEKYGLDGSVNALTANELAADHLGQVAGGLLLLGYAGLLAAAGASALRGRDISA